MSAELYGAFGIDYRNAVLERTTTKRALLLAWVLVDQAHARSSATFDLSLRQVARYMHRDTSTALRAQRELVEAALVDVETIGKPGPNASTRWTLKVPGMVPEEAPSDGARDGARDGAPGGARRGTIDPDPVPKNTPLTPLKGGKRRTPGERAAAAFAEKLAPDQRVVFEELTVGERYDVVEHFRNATGLRFARGEIGTSWRADPLGTHTPSAGERSQTPPGAGRPTPVEFLCAYLERKYAA